MRKSVGVYHVAPFASVTWEVRRSTQQRNAFQQGKEQELTKADTETLNWIKDNTLH